MTSQHRVTSEVGRLRTVLLHRPGNELKRLTPRNNADLLFDGIPWVGRAQEEHDGFAEALRSRGVEVLYVRDLLVETASDEDAREELIASVLPPWDVGPTLALSLTSFLRDLPPEELADVIIGGLAHEEIEHGLGVVYGLLGTHDFVIPPLPNLLF